MLLAVFEYGLRAHLYPESAGRMIALIQLNYVIAPRIPVLYTF